MFDVEAVRKDFPILQREVHGKPSAVAAGGHGGRPPSNIPLTKGEAG
jgi:selenocysteine lyase/cysteine desulfurase